MAHRFISLFVFLTAISGLVTADTVDPPTAAWIWKTSTPGENERVFFRREFQLPPDVVSATITIVCDDSQKLFVNGQEVGASNEWKSSHRYDVLAQLKTGGKNVISVDARNDRGSAGMALRFNATFKDGKKLSVVSDANWLCAGEAPEGWQNFDFPGPAWPKAVVIAKMGSQPWGDVMAAEPEVEQATLEAPQVGQPRVDGSKLASEIIRKN